MSARTIVITGTRKGIGKYLAEYYLSAGDDVVGCSRGAPSVEHDNYTHFSLDVTDEEAVVAMVHSIRKQHGSVDVLLNNAGVGAMNHFMMMPAKSARRVMDTNFMGTFLLSRELAKLMRKTRGGSIVNFTTVAVPLSLEGEAVYAASKSAVETFTRISARELAGFGIRVNAIGPTPVETDLVRNIPKDKMDQLLGQQIIPRFGTFEDVANVVDFFIDPRSEFITGQVIYLGGIMG